MYEAHVKRIYIAAKAGAKMEAVSHVRAFPGKGLGGDRYANESGIWQTVRNARATTRHVSIISEKNIADANAEHGTHFRPEQTRRNLLIAGEISLQDLIGKEFTIGTIRMNGVEECTPCERPSKLARTKKSFKNAFEKNYRAGIRARILSDGTISEGDVLEVLPKK